MYRLFKSKKASENQRFSGHFFPYGKKGVGVDDFFPLLFAMFIFIIAVLLLMVNYTSKQKEEINTIDEFQREIKGAGLLHMYLQKSFEDTDIITKIGTDLVYTQEKTLLGLIDNPAEIKTNNIEGYAHESFYRETKKIMDYFYPGKNWLLTINIIKDQRYITYDIEGEYFHRNPPLNYAGHVIIPASDPNRIIKLRLTLGPK